MYLLITLLLIISATSICIITADKNKKNIDKDVNDFNETVNKEEE